MWTQLLPRIRPPSRCRRGERCSECRNAPSRGGSAIRAEANERKSLYYYITSNNDRLTECVTDLDKFGIRWLALCLEGLDVPAVARLKFPNQGPVLGGIAFTAPEAKAFGIRGEQLKICNFQGSRLNSNSKNTEHFHTPIKPEWFHTIR
jgi:hypothetical protein